MNPVTGNLNLITGFVIYVRREDEAVPSGYLHLLPVTVTYRGTSLMLNCLLLGPYSRPMPRALRWS
jgi:hypothetical protein